MSEYILDPKTIDDLDFNIRTFAGKSLEMIAALQAKVHELEKRITELEKERGAK